MNISFKWLSEYIQHGKTPAELSVILTSTGLEVEGLHPYSSAGDKLDGLLVGEVMETWKHPGADKLTVTRVNLGASGEVQIVCGAPNVAARQKVVVAPVGTTLSPVKGEAFKIRKARIRGEASEGMICAEDEIGLGTDHSGIMVLDPSAIPGKAVAEVLDVYQDTIIEIGLTPNRGDAASHTGVARDLAAVLRKKVDYPAVDSFSIDELKHKITIEVKESSDCPRYMGVVVSGVKVEESPGWLKNKLKAVGLSPINNVVDVTNFVMLETGHPLHAFDLREVKDNTIIVKHARKDSEFITLDGKKRKMTGTELMICNPRGPVGIAGVMGGEGSAIKDDTTELFIECAFFNPSSIRKTAKHHNLFTDASFRFERSVNIHNMPHVITRAALMLKEICGGKISSEIEDLYPYPVQQAEIEVSFSYINKIAGAEIPAGNVKDILKHLGFDIIRSDAEGLKVLVPGYFSDVTRPVDVVEEVMRIHGFDNISFSKKITTSLTFSEAFDKHKTLNTISDFLAANGFREIYSNSLTSGKLLENYSEMLPKPVDILNPLTRELDAMRPLMLFSGLDSINYNLNRQNNNLRFFEISTVFSMEGKKYKEEQQLALWITGQTHAESWADKGRKAGFFHLKSYVNNILRKLGIDYGTEETASFPFFDHGSRIMVKDKVLAHFGSVKQQVLKRHDINQEVFYAELYLKEIFSLIRKKKTKYVPLNKFPAVKRDLSLVLPSQITFAEIKEEIIQNGKGLLRDVEVFDVYEGDKIGKGKKSYAIRLTFSDENKTLTDTLVDKVIGKITRGLEEKLEVTLRQ